MRLSFKSIDLENLSQIFDVNRLGLFVFLDHHPPSLPVGQAAEIRRRDPFQATRPFKESTFPVTMPYLVSLSNIRNNLKSIYLSFIE